MTPCMLYFLQAGTVSERIVVSYNSKLSELSPRKGGICAQEGLQGWLSFPRRTHRQLPSYAEKTLGTEEALRRIARAMDEHLTPLPDDAPCSNTQATEGEDGHCGLPDNFNQMDEG